MTLLAFLLALGVLITVHEWAHYRVAVACGVKVLTFSVGFGKPLVRWASRRPHPGQNTEFKVCIVPLGGYVRMLDEADGQVPPSLLPFAFNRQSLRVRAAIVAAGPLANLLLAVFLYACVAFHGQLETKAIVSTPIKGSVAEQAGLQSGDEILKVGVTPEHMQDVRSFEDVRWWLLSLPDEAQTLHWLVQPQGVHGQRLLSIQRPSPQLTGINDLGIQGAWTAPVIGELQAGLPAQLAGLAKGDVVLFVDGQRVDDAAMLRHMVRASGQRNAPMPQVWEVQRRQQGVLLIEVTPVHVNEAGQTFGRIGAHIGGAPATHWVAWGPVESLSIGLDKTLDMAAMTLQMLGKMLAGQASWNNLSGPLTMADYAGRTASLGLTAYLAYLAVLSVSLGVFNLLPLPMLDGGHLMYYLYEAVTGHPPSPKWLDVMQRLGLAVLMALMAVSFFNDVVRLGWVS